LAIAGLYGRVGQVGQVGRVGQVGQVGQVGRVGRSPIDERPIRREEGQYCRAKWLRE